MNIEIVKGVLSGDPVSDKAEDALEELLECERAEELAAVVNMLRAESSMSFLCGRPNESRMLDLLVERLERLEHR